MSKKIKLTGSGEMMKQLFELNYTYIHLGDDTRTNQLINHYAAEVDNGMNGKRALDLLEDGIMSQGLAGYEE